MLSLIIMVTISVMIGGGVLKFGFLSIFFEKDLVANSQGIDIDPEEKCIFNIYNNNIIVSKNSVIEAMDKNGEIKWDIPISFSNVSMDINGDYALVADIGDKEAILIYNGEVKTNIQTQEPIIMAKLNSNGYFALITEEKGYNGRIIAYSPEGTELFTNYSVNHIVDVDISNDNKLMAMCTLDSSSGEVSGSITFYHLNNDQPYSGIVLEDTLLASIKYYRDRLIAIGDDKVVGFDLKGIKDWELEFETEEIIGFDVTSDNMIVIITKEKRVGGFFSNNIVKIIDIAGNIRGTYDVGEVLLHWMSWMILLH